MKFNIFKAISERRKAKQIIKERLYYLQNIRPLSEQKKAIEECTVTKN